MTALGFRIAVQRPKSEARQVDIFVYDVENGLNGIVDDTITYKIIRKNIITAEEKVIATATKKDSNMTIKNNVVSINFVDDTTLNATTYLYRCDKVKDIYSLIDYTQTVSIQTLPQRVEDFKVNYDNSKYDELGIPSTLNLNWQSLDTAVNNFDVIGYNLYYSLSPRGKGEWSEWSKLHGFSTDPKLSYVIRTLPIVHHEVDIDVPQLADTSNPMDVMFSIVAITQDGRKSMFSDVATISLYNTITQVIDPYKTNIMNFTISSVNVRPVTLEFEAGAFDKNTTVLFNRSQYNPSLGSVDDELFTYNIKSNYPLKKWVTLKVDLQLYVGQTHEVRIFNPTTKAWDSIPSTYNGDTNQIEIVMTKITSFVIIVKGVDPKTKNILKPTDVFAKYTNKIIQQLPTWFKIRRDPLNSVGAKFLNVTGLEYDDMEFILNYAYEQVRIDKADLDQVDIVYKAKLPASISTKDVVSVRADNFSLEYVNNTMDFFNSNSGLIASEIHYTNPYIVDYEKRYVYVRKPYNPSKENKYGEVYLVVYHGGYSPDGVYFEGYVPLELHHVWNFFDEFGMLLNTPRLAGEPNIEYKERILDVFKNISNASKEGLYNGVARELGVRINKIWQDTTQDFIITEPMVTINMIKVNGTNIDLKYAYYTTDNNIVIKNNNKLYKNGSTVTYTSGIEMHTFHNRKDIRLYNQLYTIEETATDLFKYYVDLIKQKVPTDWGKFRWNEGHWDINDEKASGLGFLPVIHDGKIKGFEVIDKYGNKSGHINKTHDYIKPIVIFPPHKYIPTGKEVDLGVKVIPGDTKVKDTYWDITPVNPSLPPIVPGAPQTMDDIKGIVGKNIDNYIPSNNTTDDDLKAGFGYGITDPSVSIDLGSVGITPSTIDTDGAIYGTVTIHKTGEPDAVIPFRKTIDKGSTEGSNMQSGASYQMYSDKPGSYKYTQYVVYETPDGTTEILSDSYTYEIKEDTIGSPTYEALPSVPAQQDVVNITYPGDAVHRQYRIGETGDWIDYPSGGIVVTDNGKIYSRCDNIFGTWSTPSVLNITNIDRIPPTAAIVVGTITPTYDPVRVYCYPDEPDSVIINNGGLNYYDFTANGEFTFDIKDPAGNITHKKATIDNIVTRPHVIIDYSTLDIVDDDVLATVVSDLPITITNNGGSFTYDFLNNGTFTFEYVDGYNLPGSITAEVNNISHISPHVNIVYSVTEITEDNVIARLISDKPITITNNNGDDQYTFTSNGEFTFLYTDEWGFNYSATATVNNICRSLHKIGTDVYTYSDNSYIALDLSDPVFTNGTDVVKVYRGGILIGTSHIGSNTFTVPINTSIANEPLTFEVSGGTSGTLIGIPYTIYDDTDYLPGSFNIPEGSNTGLTFDNRFATSGGTHTVPNVYIEYSTIDPVYGNVTAKVMSDKPIIITNNNGSNTHVFTDNGLFTFDYMDGYGNTNTITAIVSNIRIMANVNIAYSETATTENDVIATLTSDRPITITNNNGSNTYTFTSNGTFTFDYTDEYGTLWTAIATVSNISRTTHISGRDIYTYSDNVMMYIYPGWPTWTDYTLDVSGNGTMIPTYAGGSSAIEVPIVLDTNLRAITCNVEHHWGSYNSGTMHIPFTIKDGSNTISGTIDVDNGGGSEILRIHNWFIGSGQTPTAPSTSITYVTNSDGSVTAKLNSDKYIIVTNNGGSKSYNFTANGTFTFQYKDLYGNTYTKEASVNSIYPGLPYISDTLNNAPMDVKIMISTDATTASQLKYSLDTKYHDVVNAPLLHTVGGYFASAEYDGYTSDLPAATDTFIINTGTTPITLSLHADYGYGVTRNMATAFIPPGQRYGIRVEHTYMG